MRVGRRLLQTAISEAKECEAFFTFAGSDAVRFFRNGGLSDDPLLCGRFLELDEDWTDATPMVAILSQEQRADKMLSAMEKWARYKK